MYSIRSAIEGALVGLFIIVVLVLVGQHKRIEALSARVDNQSATIEALSAVRKGTEKVVAAKKVRHEEARKAYEGSPDWSGDVVPDDVADLLRKH